MWYFFAAISYIAPLETQTMSLAIPVDAGPDFQCKNQ